MDKIALFSLFLSLLATASTPAQAQNQLSAGKPTQTQSGAAQLAIDPGSAQSAQTQSAAASGSTHFSSAPKDGALKTPTSASEQATILPATTRAEAVHRARANAGRTDPLAAVDGFKPFPRGATAADAKGRPSKRSSKMLIPPPPGGLQLQVPPPPTNGVGSGNAREDLPVSELPVPPDRPSIVNKLKLIGIVGQKAIFSITDLSARRLNKWPRSLMLGAGEHFESVEVVSIGADSALLEENGDQTTKRLERIR